MSTGRPSKYKPEFCEMLIEHMKNGGSFTTFAAIVEVNADTLHEWCKVHEAFSETKKIAIRLSEKWWEDASKAGMMGQLTRVKERHYDEKGNVIKEVREPAHFNATVWVFTMKNRYNWRDKRELTGKDGGAFEIAETRKTAVELLKSKKTRALALQLAEAMDEDEETTESKD